MELKIDQFINYFFDKYGLEEANIVFILLSIAINIVLFLGLLGIYDYVAVVKNKNLNVKTNNKRYMLWKNQYFMIPYCIIVGLYFYFVFIQNGDFLNRIEKGIDEYNRGYISSKNYTYQMFKEDLNSSKILEELNVEESNNIQEKIITIMYDNEKLSLTTDVGEGLAPIEINEIKVNLKKYKEKEMK